MSNLQPPDDGPESASGRVRSRSRASAEPDLEAEPQAEPEVEAAPRTEPDLEAVPQAEPEVEAEPRTEPDLEPAPRADPDLEAAPRAESGPEGTSVRNGSVLRAEGLVRSFKRRCVVNEVEIRVRQGEIVGLLGPNGAGKTTTFYMIVGLLKADRGRVYLDDEEITRWPMYRRARAGIGYLPQEASVFQKLTVEQNVMAILETQKLSRQERRDRLEELLDELSIKHLRANKAYSLSGGERRRLEITRALVTRPKFLLLDEPFTGVDPIAIEDIQRIVKDLRDKGLGVLITDHNVRETLSITDRAYLLFEGKILVQGAADRLVNDPEARELYLGTDFRL